MFLCDWSTLILIRLLTVLLFCVDVLCDFTVVFQSVVCGVLCDAMFSLKDGSRI
jgi:hypothetical protein